MKKSLFFMALVGSQIPDIDVLSQFTATGEVMYQMPFVVVVDNEEALGIYDHAFTGTGNPFYTKRSKKNRAEFFLRSSLYFLAQGTIRPTFSSTRKNAQQSRHRMHAQPSGSEAS
ncbi:hypothetical protein SAMN05518846_104194 [Brevibacillus centrosporus]|uniref:Uncharacterized protein n=1 Tax=Brevibacillus centrosporus TaxID=54910 RepID=A0A1I3SK30_9BACL|nr:hypothetical protein SAMN05518846_104194 [Brevibacillus centrosporus]